MSRLCLLVALVALAITWFFIVSFVVDDLYAPQYAALDWQHYLVESKRFVKCYVAVSSDSAQRWVWSSQLLFAVHALIVALFVDGTRRGLARSLWKYVCLSFFCAISVALPLFIARSNIADYGVAARRRPRTMSPSRLRSLSPSRLRATHQRRDDDGEGDGAAMAAATTPPITGWFFLCILAGLVSTYLTPFLSSSTYSFNLMFVHVVLLLPFLVDALNRGAANQHESARVVRVALLYAMIGGASAIAHVSSLVRALSLSTDFKQLLIAPLGFFICVLFFELFVRLILIPSQNTIAHRASPSTWSSCR